MRPARVCMLPGCGKPVLGHGNNRYCSPACRAAGNKRYAEEYARRRRTCPHCGKEIPALRRGDAGSAHPA